MNSRPDNDPLKFQPKTPHFFKIILGDTIHSGKLMIPPRFTRKYGKDLPSTVILNVPTGATWRVELVRCGGAEIWLQNGWEEFADYYSLTYGHLLLFQYKGNHDFHVLIFDMSATEIEYPLGSLHRDDEQGFQDQEVEESETDISVEILEERLFSCRSDAGSKPTNKNQKPSKTESARTMFGVDKARALSRASAFKSTNPFFKVVMQPSFVQDGYRLAVPSGFAREHFPKRSGDNDIILSLSDTARTWRANYYLNIEREKTRVRFFGGWKEFVEDNNMGVGDVCVFELINEKYMMFHVFIFRLNDEDVNCPLPAEERLFSDRSDVGRMPTNNNQKPSETESARCMQPMLGGEKAKAVCRASAFKCTNVTLKKKTKPAASKTTRHPTPVHIGRNSSRAKQTAARSFQGKLNGRGKGIQEESELTERKRVAEEINSIVLESPYFVQVLKDYHRHKMSWKRLTLRILIKLLPRGFVKATGLQKKKRIVIKDMEGREWPVEVCVRRKQSVQVNLSTGFYAFLKANKLVPGDTVVFHFMKTVGQIHVQIHPKGGAQSEAKQTLQAEQVKSEPESSSWDY
ncbi:hypothetical protein Tsubulata_009862 [Turnera subulata]|uniref:TF-B3 domain-containing protein n=1 Tax=Turnera subulata TaxID=218843 RepID=A0A9Q0G468_9ROSI|nr:hypothetical protein Tsubulata_009862 [Turnera subulata]